MTQTPPLPPKGTRQLPLRGRASSAQGQGEAATGTGSLDHRLGSAGTRLVPLHTGAVYAHVHDDTIRRRIACGDLTRYRFGPKKIYVDLNEIDALLSPLTDRTA